MGLLLPRHRILHLPLLKFIKFLSAISPIIYCISHFSQLCIACKLAESAFGPIVQIVKENDKWYWCQYQLLGYSTCDWHPDGLHTTDDNSLSPAIQPIFKSPHCLFIEVILHHLAYEEVVGDNVKTTYTALSQPTEPVLSWKVIRSVRHDFDYSKSSSRLQYV